MVTKQRRVQPVKLEGFVVLNCFIWGAGSGNWELFGVSLVPKGSVPSSQFPVPVLEKKKKKKKNMNFFAAGSPGSLVVELGTRTRTRTVQKPELVKTGLFPGRTEICLVDSKHETCQDIDFSFACKNSSSIKGRMDDSKKLFCKCVCWGRGVWGGIGVPYLQLSDLSSLFPSGRTYIGSMMCHRYLEGCRVLKTLILTGINPNKWEEGSGGWRAGRRGGGGE